MERDSATAIKTEGTSI
uniref:Uncharacterized protein n=1 Tax=Arundo donax TaxID=35708 RepID=A0A0A9A2A0_ARUDO